MVDPVLVVTVRFEFRGEVTDIVEVLQKKPNFHRSKPKGLRNF